MGAALKFILLRTTYRPRLIHAHSEHSSLRPSARSSPEWLAARPARSAQFRFARTANRVGGPWRRAARFSYVALRLSGSEFLITADFQRARSAPRRTFVHPMTALNATVANNLFLISRFSCFAPRSHGRVLMPNSIRVSSPNSAETGHVPMERRACCLMSLIAVVGTHASSASNRYPSTTLSA